MGRQKKQVTKNILYRGEKISVYMRPTTQGTKRLYLDMRTGSKRYYDFKSLKGLELTGDAAHDADVLALVKQIIAIKQMETVANKAGVVEPHKARQSFLDYFDSYANKQKTTATRALYGVTLKHLREFVGKGGLTFGDVDEKFILGFQEHLRERVSANSAIAYLSKLNTVLRVVQKAKYIATNPMQSIADKDKITSTNKLPTHLTLSELERLAQTPCTKPEVAQMFLFSCATGLRFSDVQALRWGNVQDGIITIKQQKTGKDNDIPLSESAMALMGAKPPKAMPFDTVFTPISKQLCWVTIKQWVEDAGIQKRISFHTSRHTFAVLGLQSGTALKTLSSLMGHSSIAMTERYAKVVDESKRIAIDNMPIISFQKKKAI
jgi:site-specific recombinase XerD